MGIMLSFYPNKLAILTLKTKYRIAHNAKVRTYVFNVEISQNHQLLEYGQKPLMRVSKQEGYRL